MSFRRPRVLQPGSAGVRGCYFTAFLDPELIPRFGLPDEIEL